VDVEIDEHGGPVAIRKAVSIRFFDSLQPLGNTPFSTIAAKGGGDGHRGRRAMQFTGVKIFSATKAKEREELGEVITRWLKANAHFEIVDKIVTQSSDNEFHCLTISLFYREK
jgi:hypothetical protein